MEGELFEERVLCDVACAKVAANVDKGGEGAGGDALDALEGGGGGVGVGVEDEGVPGACCGEVAGEGEHIVVEGVGGRGGMGGDEVEAEGVDEDEDGAVVCLEEGRGGCGDVGEGETGEQEAPGEEVDGGQMGEHAPDDDH